eukprot:CCRYP_021233-RA/>CCRYP_021233-RA protein AED:0.19 eAED:0.19 QI:1615/0.57/0.5/1/0/0/8/0/352
MQRMMCFALPALLNLLMYPMVHMFVDATFNIVPHPFYQCLIIMVFDARLRIFIPVAWILMTGKTNECYWQAFNWLCSAVDEIAPAYIGVDFERAFFTQVSNHFAKADLIGCLFHFKQALRRKMIKLGIPEEEVKFVMQKGVIDLITVIPVEHLNPKVEPAVLDNNLEEHFYHRIQRYEILAPLTNLVGECRHTKVTRENTTKKKSRHWDSIHQQALNTVKATIAHDVTLAYPDYSQGFEIYTDSSKPLAFFSRKLSPTQQNHSVTKQELLTIVETLKEFKGMLWGQQITVYTDHKTLMQDALGLTSDKVICWRLLLEEYGPTIVYIKDINNTVADAISRLDYGPSRRTGQHG